MAETKLERIMDLLRDRELTSLEIASEINIPTKNCSSYLNTLYKDGRIERINDKRPYKYKIATKPIELLKQLYEIMDNRMEFTEKPTELEQQVILKIEVLIN